MASLTVTDLQCSFFKVYTSPLYLPLAHILHLTNKWKLESLESCPVKRCNISAGLAVHNVGKMWGAKPSRCFSSRISSLRTSRIIILANWEIYYNLYLEIDYEHYFQYGWSDFEIINIRWTNKEISTCMYVEQGLICQKTLAYLHVQPYILFPLSNHSKSDASSESDNGNNVQIPRTCPLRHT